MSSSDNAVEKKIESLVSGNKVFTAWNITDSLRRDEKLKISHNEVRGIVQNLFGQGKMGPNYERRILTNSTFYPPPWLYFPQGYDLSRFTGRIDEYSNVTQNASSSINSFPKSLLARNEKIRSLSKDGILYIPNTWIRKIVGYLGYVRIKDSNPVNLSNILTLIVDTKCDNPIHIDPHDNARVTKKNLMPILSKSGKYLITLRESDKEIDISPYYG